MAYASQQDIIDLYGEDCLSASADRDSDGSADSTPVTNALDTASNEIDSYLGTLYDIPLTSVPDQVKTVCIDIAIYRLSYGFGAGLTDEKAKRYDNAIRWLRDAAKGIVTLAVDTGPVETSANVISFHSDRRQFVRCHTRGL